MVLSLLSPAFLGAPQAFQYDPSIDLRRPAPDRGLIGGNPLPGRNDYPWGDYPMGGAFAPAGGGVFPPPPSSPANTQMQQQPAPPPTPPASQRGGGLLDTIFGSRGEPNLALLALGSQIGGDKEAWARYAPAIEGQRQAKGTRDFLIRKGIAPEDADIIAGNQVLMNHYLKPGATDEYSQRTLAAQQFGLTGDEAKTFVLTGKLPGDPNARDKFGNQVIWGQDEQGNWVAMQPNSAGGLVAAETPKGIKLSPPGIGNVDTGTGTVFRDRNGKVIGGVDKNVADVAAEKLRGAAIADYRSMSSKMPHLEQVITQLDDLSTKATYTAAGQLWNTVRTQVGAGPSEGQIARTSYESIVANQILPLLRDTFGAQFTAREGDTLMATMGDPDKTPEEKQAVLKAFIEQKRADIQAKAAEAGINNPPARIGGDVAQPSTQEDFDALPSGALYRDPDDGQLYRKP